MVGCIGRCVVGRGGWGCVGVRRAAVVLALLVFVMAGVVRGEGAGASLQGLLMRVATTEGAERKVALQALARTGDGRLEKTLEAFSEGSLYVWKGRVVECDLFEKDGSGGKVAALVDPVTQEAIVEGGKAVRVGTGELTAVDASRRDRLVVRDVLTVLRLSAPDGEARLAAVIRAGESTSAGSLPALKEMEPGERNGKIRAAIQESIALIELNASGTDVGVVAKRVAAAKLLGEMESARALPALKDLQKHTTDAGAKKVYARAIAKIERWQTVVEWCGIVFSGLSASSILILMALGLSIIFGLMGVINMAHGELMMIGAYATYVTQELFVKCLPASAFNWYFVAAIPMSFVVAGLVGVLLEATVVRFLYGRPLETLLATWGVSLLLIQMVRVEFGDNIAVNSPTWLRGSVEVMQDLMLPYNRLFIIGFCLACIGLMYFIIEKTKLGLLLRATTQNRTMAASLGVSTRKIDMLTFGLGAGLAGLAGCALTQIGGVTPDMGGNYVIDSFLVVVTGGVGKLAGAIWTGLGLGMINKFMEPFFGTVWAKVLILLLVVGFIQRKPSGLFPAKGRTADV
ncbi:MAG: urea ABC transporter permease subunit UrtB [Phycisphaerae bacterium]